MELTMEVKGAIARCAVEILGHDKFALFAMEAGVDPKETMEINNKTAKAILILDKVPKENAEIVIKAIFELSKKATWIQKCSEWVRNEINFAMERTMNCRMDENGEITPIFDSALRMEEKQSYIEKKLEYLEFTKSLIPYQDALKVYRTSSKGSTGLLRVAFDALTEEILNKEGITPHKNFKDRLTQLENFGLLKEISKTACSHCHHKKQDAEYNFTYDFYSLLSHYGSHPSLVTEKIASWLYTSTSAFIWFFLNRYEKLSTSP